MEVPFSHDEVKNTINSMTSDKAPGPDGFTGAFFKACWEIIKEDVMAAMNSLFILNAQGFEWLNSACIILLPKKRMQRELPILDPSASSTALQRSSPNY